MYVHRCVIKGYNAGLQLRILNVLEEYLGSTPTEEHTTIFNYVLLIYPTCIPD